MKTSLRHIPAIGIALFISALPAIAQNGNSGIVRAHGSIKRLQAVDFESFSLESRDRSLPNPLTIDGVTFRDPAVDDLTYGFCTSPTCSPDPDNPIGGNTELFLNTGATISFANTPRRVVLDIQGIGDERFVLLVTDTRGRTRRIEDQGVLFGRKLVGVFSHRGIASIEVVSISGPLAVAQVLFSKK